MKRTQLQRRTRLRRKAPLNRQRKPIRPVSKKQRALNRRYTKLRRAFLAEHTACEAALPNYTGRVDHVHHKEGRGIRTNDVTTWLAVCAACHSAIHDHRKASRAAGL